MKRFVKGLSAGKTDFGDYFNAYMAFHYTKTKCNLAPVIASEMQNMIFDIFARVDLTACETVGEMFNALVDSVAYPSINTDLVDFIIDRFQTCRYTHKDAISDRYTQRYDNLTQIEGFAECAKDYLITLGTWSLTGNEKDYSEAYKASRDKACSAYKKFYTEA